MRRDNAPDQDFQTEKWYDDKGLGYVSQALADEVSASPSFLTLKTNQGAEKAIFFLPLLCTKFQTLVAAYFISATAFIYLWIQDKCVNSVSFARRLSVISSYLPPVSYIQFCIYPSNFLYFLLSFRYQIEVSDSILRIDLYRTFIICFSCLLWHIQTPTLINVMTA